MSSVTRSVGCWRRDNGAVLRPTKTYSGPPRGIGYLPRHVLRLLEQHGGIVSTRELRAIGVEQTMLEIYRDYTSLQAVRQGWHCAPSVPDIVRLAWRFGGPLACISALALHDARAHGEPIATAHIAQPLHVCIPSNAARVPTAELLARRWGISVPLEPIIHWSTNDHLSGNRQAVSRTIALRQADQCGERGARGA